jgi:hypothetical protein
VGLLLAFAISGALQRFDERKQLVLQEANAISSAYDRLDLLESEARLKLKKKLKEYVKARMDLYRMPVEFAHGQDQSLRSNNAKIQNSPRYGMSRGLSSSQQPKRLSACPAIVEQRF